MKAVYEQMWRDVITSGVMGLTRWDWRALAPELSEPGQLILKRFLEQLESQSRWVQERTDATRNEGDRIERIGLMMKRGGLRSYTDEAGRVFVAGEP